MLDAKAERTLAEVTGQLQAICGERLVAIALYGTGATPDFVPGRSDLNLIVVLDELDDRLLPAVRSHVRRWRKRGVVTPLLVDRAFLRTAADVFPMELYDMRERHRVLVGEDVFAALDIRDQYLRYQCEQEARGKLLRLRELYLEVGGPGAQLQKLMLDSLTTFLVIIRTANRLRGIAPTPSYEASLQRFGQTFDCAMPVMARLLRIRLGQERWIGDDDETFQSYLREVRQLVDIIDSIVTGGPRPDAGA